MDYIRHNRTLRRLLQMAPLLSLHGTSAATTTHGLPEQTVDKPLGVESPQLNTTYEIIWTPEVVFRVTTIVILMVLTIFGNTILIAIILCHRKLRKKRVNIFLVNLAIGDLMVCLVTMTTEILFVAFGEWVLGAVACKVTVYAQMVTLASATFLLTGMSIDRYQVIVRPLQSLTGQPSISKKVIIAWLMAFTFAIPQLFIFVQTDEGIKPDGSMKHMCISKGYTEGAFWQRKVYFTFLTTYILVIPTIIMTFCYVNIIHVVFMRTGREQPVNPKLRFTSAKRKTCADSRKSSSESQNEIEYSLSNGRPPHRWVKRRSACAENRLSIPRKLISSSKRKVVKMTLSVIIAFIFCWSPYFVVGLIRIYSEYSIKLKLFYSVAEILAMMHSALNPILYGVFSTQSAMKIFKTFCRKRKAAGRTACDQSLISDFNSLVFATNPRSTACKSTTKVHSVHPSKDSDDENPCVRVINKICFYCSCGKKKAKQFYNEKSKLGFFPHTCNAGCSANTDSTFVEASVAGDNGEDCEAHLQIDESGVVYEAFPCRKFTEGNQGHDVEVNTQEPCSSFV